MQDHRLAFHIWDPSIQHFHGSDGTDGSITRRYDMDCLKRAYAFSYNEQHPDAAVNFIGGVYVEVDTGRYVSLEDRLLSENHDPLLLATSMRSTVGPAMRMPLYARMAFVNHCIRRRRRGDGACKIIFIRGLRLMADKNMPFDACVEWMSLAILLRFASRCPKRPSSLTIWATYPISKP